MAICNYCGSEIQDNVSICPNCGSAVTPVQSAQDNTGIKQPTKRGKQTCIQLAKVFLIITAVCAFIIAPYNIISNIVALFDIEDSVNTAIILYENYAQLWADLDIELPLLGAEFFTPLMYVACALSIVHNLFVLLLGVWSLIVSRLCTRANTKKQLLAPAIITLVLMLLFDGGLIGIAAGILMLSAPKREFGE